MIFNQWQTGQCEGYAFLAALYILDPSIDYQEIDRELQAEKIDLAYPWRAWQWFLDKGYIKSYEPIEKIQMKSLLSRWIPLITGSRYGDFTKVKSPLFELPFSKSNTLIQHKHTIIKDEWYHFLHQNSWGEQWGDKGCFRVRKEDYKYLDAMWRVIPNIQNPHNTIIKKYMGGRVDYDNVYDYQCVDWIREYNSLRSRPITKHGNAYQLWTVWLWDNWKMVVKTTLNAPSEWDVVIWGTTLGKWFWHIAIANRFCNPMVLRTTDQNAGNGNWDWLWKNSITPFFRSYKWVVGWYTWIG